MKKALSIIFSIILALSFTACSPMLKEREYEVNAYRTTMQFHDDFKILQLTDLHFGIESNLDKQLCVVKNAIRSEKPDLIILTGDNFMYATKSIVKNLMKTLSLRFPCLQNKKETLIYM